MRIGLNPHKDKPIESVDYTHQVVMPVYIPNLEGYFEKSFEVLQLSLNSLFNTIHSKTFITIVNNGSCAEVVQYLNKLYGEKRINEVIHSSNIGKVNAILKGIQGHNIELVTISDSDVLFLPYWQAETVKVFKKVPKAGVVGIVPQFKSYMSKSENVLFHNLFNDKLKFLPVKNKQALIHFYDSIGWKRDYNEDYLKYTLGLEIEKDFKVLIGSGHFVSTYKRSVFDTIQTFIGYKLGGTSEHYLDGLPLRHDYWRLTTYDNYAYHIGNVPECWMYDTLKQASDSSEEIVETSFYEQKRNFKLVLLRNKIFRKLIMNKMILSKLYVKWQLPKESIKNY